MAFGVFRCNHRQYRKPADDMLTERMKHDKGSNMGKLIYIMGKSSTGKDSIYRSLLQNEELGLKKIIMYTTRPMRTGEKNGREYFFVSPDKFDTLAREGKVIESRTYQTVAGPWTYFTADDDQIDLENGSCIMIGTLESYLAVRDKLGRENVLPVYIEVEDGERLRRALAREKSQKQPAYEEMCRRFIADNEDFSEDKLEAAGIEKRYINNILEDCILEIANDIRRASAL